MKLNDLLTKLNDANNDLPDLLRWAWNDAHWPTNATPPKQSCGRCYSAGGW